MRSALDKSGYLVPALKEALAFENPESPTYRYLKKDLALAKLKETDLSNTQEVVNLVKEIITLDGYSELDNKVLDILKNADDAAVKLLQEIASSENANPYYWIYLRNELKRQGRTEEAHIAFKRYERP